MAILRFVVFYRPKYFSKCAVSGCDFEIYVKKKSQKSLKRVEIVGFFAFYMKKCLSLYVIDLKSVFWQRCARAFIVSVQKMRI